MIKGCIFLYDDLVYCNEVGRNTNHITFEIEDFSEIDEILDKNDIQYKDITMIDLRGY